MCKATVQSQVLTPQLRVGWLFVCFFIVINFFSILFYYTFIYLFMYLFFTFSPLWLLILFLFAYLLFVCVLLRFFLFLFFPSLFILCAVFISLRVGLGLIFCWSETKISYFGVVYKFLSVGMELVVIKDLFIILYI